MSRDDEELISSTIEKALDTINIGIRDIKLRINYLEDTMLFVHQEICNIVSGDSGAEHVCIEKDKTLSYINQHNFYSMKTNSTNQ